MKLKLILSLAVLVLPLFCANAQTDRREVRSGNRKYAGEKWKEAELEYRKARLKDSLSIAASYNLASSLYRQQDIESAAKALDALKGHVEESPHAADWYYNRGDVALAAKDWSAAADAFRECLLLNPGDMDAKENYIYAKEMMKRDSGGGGGQNQQDQQQNQQNQQDQDNKDQQNNQDQQNQDQNQDQNKDQNQDQNQDQDQQNQKPQPSAGQQIDPQQARQMLNAVQAREQETQEKVRKEKAALLKSREKEKNW